MHQDLGKSPKRFPTWLLPALGYTLSAASLFWVFRDYDFDRLSHLASWDWRYVTLAVIVDLSVYLSHAWRWNILLKPVARPSFWRSVQAIYIGLYANEILPLRTGEVIRCYLMSHSNDGPISVALSSIAIERVLDGIWLVIGLMIAASRIELPQELMYGVWALATGLCCLTALLIFVAVHKQKAHAFVLE